MKHTWIGVAASTLLLSSAIASVTTFEEFVLPPGGYLNGSDESGGFTNDGVTFFNNYNVTYGSWSGFSVSNQTDTTTAGWVNQYSVYSSGGAGGSSQFAVGYYSPYETSTIVELVSPASLLGLGASFNNTTYTALEMANGGAFGAKKFGGASGDDPDWLVLTIEGFLGGSSTGTVDFYLADFRFADNSQDYIIDEWTWVDFSALGSVDELRFTMDSSDLGAFGINTPTYFAMDDFMAVPEPSSLLASLGGLVLLLRRRRETRSR